MVRIRGILLITIGVLLGLAAGPAQADAAIFVVTDAGDPAPGACVSGVDCSLREAVSAANASGTDDTVQLAADVTLSISAVDDSNAGGDLDVSAMGGDLTIEGTGASRARILQNDRERVIDVPVAGPDLTLLNVSLESGEPMAPAQGGGVRFRGASTALTLDDAAVSGNVVDGTLGGGVFVGGSAAALRVINGSDVVGNSGADVGGGIGFAGGSLTITDSQVNGNSAADAGGGILVETQSLQMTLTNATINGNEAGGGGVRGEGGGVWILTEGTGTNTVDVTGGTISGNSAGGGGGGGGGGGDGVGGGLYLNEFDVSGTVTNSMTVDGTTLDENTAGGEGGDGIGSGGAISSGAWDLTLTGVTVSDNRAGVSDDAENPAGFGGGIVAGGGVGEDLEIQGSLLTRNEASEASGDSGEGGGAVYKLGIGNLTIADSAITDNSVGGPDDASGGVQGAGVFRFQDGSATVPSDSIVRSSISGNEATGGTGAAGAGLSLTTPGSFAIDRSSFTDNTATGGTSASGGGIRFEVFGDDGAATLVNSTVHGNRALAPSMGAFGGFGGGVIANINVASTPLLISHSTITSNEAEAGDPDSEAGNLYADGDPVEIRATIIAGGVAGDSGHENCLNFPGITQYVSLGENLEDTSPTQCELVAAGDQVGVDPMLAPPALNGLPAGNPVTRALLPGSPALDSVPAGGLCPAVDQRGVARPQGGACDAGAFELGVDPPAPPAQPPLAAPKTKKKCKKGSVKKKVKGKSKCVKKKPKK